MPKNTDNNKIKKLSAIVLILIVLVSGIVAAAASVASSSSRAASSSVPALATTDLIEEGDYYVWYLSDYYPTLRVGAQIYKKGDESFGFTKGFMINKDMTFPDGINLAGYTFYSAAELQSKYGGYIDLNTVYSGYIVDCGMLSDTSTGTALLITDPNYLYNVYQSAGQSRSNIDSMVNYCDSEHDHDSEHTGYHAFFYDPITSAGLTVCNGNKRSDNGIKVYIPKNNNYAVSVDPNGGTYNGSSDVTTLKSTHVHSDAEGCFEYVYHVHNIAYGENVYNDSVLSTKEYCDTWNDEHTVLLGFCTKTNTTIDATILKCTKGGGDEALETPVKSGYTFMGWEVLGDQSSGLNYGTVNGNVFTYGTTPTTIRAIWQKNIPTSTLTINPNGGKYNGSTSNTTVTQAQNTTLELTVPTRDDYVFIGWEISPSTTNGSLVATNTSLYTYTFGTTNTTLKAKWKSQYVNYVLNNYKQDVGKSTYTLASSTTVKAKYNTILVLDDIKNSYTGYVFKGGVGSTSGSTTLPSSFDTKVLVSENGDTVVNMYYSLGNYTLTVNPNGGTWNNTTSNSTYTIAYGYTKTIANPTRTGYTFSNWSVSGTASTLTGTTFTMGTANATLQANWTANTNTKYTVKHWQQNINGTASSHDSTNYTLKDTDNLTGTSDASVTPSVKSYTGFTSPSTQTKTISADGSLVINYYYTRNSYTLTVKPNSGTWNSTTSNSSFTLKYGETKTIANPTRSGYKFNKWTLSGTGSSLSGTTFTMGSANATLTADWSAVFTMTINYNGGTYNSSSSKSYSVTYDTTNNNDISSELPTKVGYTFNGIYTATSGGTQIFNSSGKITNDGTYWKNSKWSYTNDVTFYAQWTANTNTKYTVKHWQQNINGTASSHDSTNYTLKDTDNLTGTTASSVTPAVKTYAGFTSPSTQTVTISADGSRVVNYYYTRNSYTLTVKPNSGTWNSTTSNSSFTMLYGATKTIANPTRTGYKFNNWTISGTGSGMSGTTFTMGSANTTLTASWTACTYTVTINYNGGTYNSNTSKSYTMTYASTTNNNLASELPTREGYDFNGFYTAASGGTQIYSSSGAITNEGTYWSSSKWIYTGNVTFYAQWTPHTYIVQFDGNGTYTGSVASMTCKYGTSYSMPANGFTRAGYTFVGWNSASDGSGSAYGAGNSFKNLTSTDGECLVYYAQWSVNSSYVTHLYVNPNGGEYRGNSNTSVYTYSPASAETKTFNYTGGYQTYTVPYDGYYYIEAAGGQGGADSAPGGGGGLVKAYVKLTKGTVLYIGVGQKGFSHHGDDYPATYPVYGAGARAGNTGDSGNWSGTGGGATIVATSLYGNGDIRYYTSDMNSLLVVAGGGGGGSDDVAGAGGVVLYQGSGSSYSVANGASTGALNGRYAYGSDPGSSDGGGGGGGFIGGICGYDKNRSSGGGASFVNTSRGVYNSVLIPGNRYGNGYVSISYFESNGQHELTDPTRVGHSFVNWVFSGSGKFNYNASIPLYWVDFTNGDSTVTATWRIHTSTLKIDPNGGTWNGYTTTQSYTQNYNTTRDIPIPTRKGYIFIGWKRTNTYGTMSSLTEAATYTYGPDDVVTDTLTAQWKPITYTVYLHPNRPSDTTRSSGYVGEHDVIKSTPSGWTWDATVSAYKKVFTYDSTTLQAVSEFYSLEGWHLDTSDNWYETIGSNGSASGNKYTTGDMNLRYIQDSTIDLYPKWVKNSYTITYNSNTGSTNIFGDTYTTTPTGSVSSNSCSYDTDVTLSTNGYTREGYIFVGWSTNPNWGKTQTSVTAWDSKRDSAKITNKFNSNTTKVNTATTSSDLYLSGQSMFKPNFTSTNGGSITLYAIWEPIRYKVQYNTTDSSPTWNTQTSYYQTNGMSSDTTDWLIFDRQYTMLQNKFSRQGSKNSNPDANIPTYTATDGSNNTQIQNGYTFIGWGTSSTQKTYTTMSEAQSSTTKHALTDKATIKNLTSENEKIIDLYALWKKNLTLTFNMNGGQYIGSTSTKTLTSTIYNDKLSYSFNVNNSKTAVNTSQTVQTNTIDAFGTWDTDGLNNLYSKIDESTGLTYRFLGWNTDKNATTPLPSLAINTNTNRVDLPSNIEIYDNTTLYAIWEPILSIDISMDRTLGTLSTNSTYKTRLTSVTKQTTNPTLTTVIRPGEQGYYTIATSNKNINVSVTFDSQITKMYDNKNAKWYDNLNPVSNIATDGDSNPKDVKEPTQSLNRRLKTLTNELVTRKFYIPQYLGTSQSYSGNQGVSKYTVTYTITGDNSYFYNNTPETIQVNGILYLSQNVLPDTDNGGSTNTGTEPDSVLSEFKTTVN